MEKIKNFFRSEKGQVAIALIVALSILALTYASVFLFQNRDIVFAEELTNNAILNFNQLAFTTYNSSVTGVNMLSHDASGVIHITGSASYNTNFAPFGNDITTTSGHKYYLSMIKDDPETRFVYNLFGSNVNVYSDVSMFYTSTGVNARLGFFAYSNKVYNTYVKINLVDLTQMFGSGNEPATVEEVKNYLPLDYYSYNPGTPVSLNYMDGFSSGMDAINAGFTVDQVASDFVNLAYSVDGSDITRNNNQLGFNGVIGITMKYTLIANDYIIIRLTCLSGTIFDIQQIGSNGEYITLQHVIADNLPNQVTTGGGWTYCSGDLTVKLVNDASAIYFNGGGFITVSDVYYKTFNYNAALENAYQQGKQDYIDRELPAIKNNEYQRGKQDGIQSANDYSFISLFMALFDAPVKVLTGLLDFEVLGMNLKSFFFSLFTIFLVLALINFIMAKRGDKS